MRNAIVCGITALTGAFLLVACGATTLGPVTWLDRPLDGAALPLAPVKIQAHASDADGVGSIEFLVDGAPLDTASADGGRLVQAVAEWNPTGPGTYTIQARGIDSQGNAGSEARSVVTVGELTETSPTLPAEPGEGELILLVEPDIVPLGGCASLRWQVNPPQEALLDGEAVPSEGEREVCPEATTSYELLIPESGETRTAILVVEGEPEPEPEQEPAPPSSGEVRIAFTADRTNLELGQCTTLRWSVEGGFAVELNGQPVERSGQSEACPEETTAYFLSVDAGVALEEREIVVVVGSPPQPTQPPEPVMPPSQPGTPPPGSPVPTSAPGCAGAPLISSFTASPGTITAGQPSTLSWGPVTNGDSEVLVRSVVINPGLGEVGSPGSRVVSPGSTTTYTLVATGCGGTAQRQVTVVVNPAAFSTDLAITDLYPETGQGPVYVRITNHGPGNINNVNIQLSCQWDEISRGVLHNPGQVGPMPITIGSLSPGQTKAFNAGILVDLSSYDYDMTCSIQVPFSDPNPGNNSYSESFPG